MTHSLVVNVEKLCTNIYDILSPTDDFITHPVHKAPHFFMEEQRKRALIKLFSFFFKYVRM